MLNISSKTKSSVVRGFTSSSRYDFGVAGEFIHRTRV